MKNNRTLAILALAAFSVGSAQAADVRVTFDNGNGDGDFGNPVNWSTVVGGNNELPGWSTGSPSNAIIQGAFTVDVTSAFTPANDFTPLLTRFGSTLNIGANLNLANTGLLFGQIAGNTDVVNQTAGTVTTNGLTIGEADVTFTMTGGVMNISGGMLMQNGDGAVFSLRGDTATISAASLTLEAADATTAPGLDFRLGATGINPIAATGAFTIGAGSTLSVDGSSYTGGAGPIDLVTFGSNIGSFADPADISISGFTGFNTSVGYDADSMFINLTAIPEPSSAALLGLAGLALIFHRRKQ